MHGAEGVAVLDGATDGTIGASGVDAAADVSESGGALEFGARAMKVRLIARLLDV